MNLLIVGLGSMGRRRARLAGSLGHTIFGVDSAEARRAEAAQLGITAYAGIEEALGQNHYSAALVCTAPLSHAAITDALLDGGLPVFSELNLVPDGYEDLIKKARAKRLPLFLSSTMLYRGETAYIAKKVAEFAKPVNYIYHIGQYLPDWHPWEDYRNFFVGNARTGGVREILGIELPWLTGAFGPARPVCVQHDTLSSLGLPYPDSVAAVLRHQNGTRGVLSADVVSPRAVRSFEVYGEGLHLFWEGSPATLYRWDAEKREKVAVDTYQSYEQDPRYSDNIVENAYLDELIEFLEVLKGKATPRWSFEQDLEVLRLMDEIDAYGGEKA